MMLRLLYFKFNTATSIYASDLFLPTGRTRRRTLEQLIHELVFFFHELSFHHIRNGLDLMLKMLMKKDQEAISDIAQFIVFE